MIITTNITSTDLQNGANGLELKSVTVVVNFQEAENYFGGQVVLTKDDNITFQSTTEEFASLAIEKAKSLIASSKVAKPEPEPELEPLPEDNTETEEPTEPTEPTDENIKATDGGTEEKEEETTE